MVYVFQTQRSDPVDIKIVFLEKVPKILKEGPGINIAPARLELKNACRVYCTTEAFQSCKFVPFNIYLDDVQPAAIQSTRPIVFKANCADDFAYVEIYIEVFKLSVCQTSKTGPCLVRI